ncbi:Fanconi-associated nuclease 1-like protein [Hibiscus syriacus]|uniref:Fanconi-associated nuclease n=1 Tax=Hibiscus syriacus TaxID=106335 RepID=A0A6A3CFM6_HIBSY|nr:Fanconi-associated nuclease 1-like protein [Hibiscus syriacus]
MEMDGGEAFDDEPNHPLLPYTYHTAINPDLAGKEGILNLLSDRNGSLAETECSKGESGIPSSDLVTCPVCGNKVRGEDYTINSHLVDSDACLSRRTKRKLTQRTLIELDFGCYQSKLQISSRKSEQFPSRDLSKSCCDYGENVTLGFSEISSSEEKGCDQSGQLSHTESVKQIDVASSTENPISDKRANIVVEFPALSTYNHESRHHMDETLDSISERPIDTFIVGHKFSDEKDVNLGASISLLREPDNIKDPNAIKVISVCCKVFGYLPRELARYLSPLIEKFSLSFEGYVIAVPEHSLDAIPIQIVCQNSIFNGEKGCDEFDVFKHLWQKALQVAEFAKDHQPNKPKYQKNFCLLLKEVLTSSPHLFKEDEKKFIESFTSLSEDAQRLFVRLYTRKGPWFRLSTIMYPEICDPQQAAKELSATGYLYLFEDKTKLNDDDVKDLLSLLTVSELRDIFCTLKKKFNQGSRKHNFVASLLSCYKDGSCPVLPLRILERTGICIRTSSEAESLFGGLRCSYSGSAPQYRLFFLNGEHDLSAFLLVDLGIVKYPTYKCIISEHIFLNKTDLLAYEEAIEVAQIMDQSLDENNSELVLRSIMIADSRISSSPKKLIDSTTLELKATFLSCFSALWVYSKVILLGISFLEREHRLEDARKAINCVDSSWIQGNKVRVFMARYHPRDVFWRKKFSGPYPVEGKSVVKEVSHTEAPFVGSVDESNLSTLKNSLVEWCRIFIKRVESSSLEEAVTSPLSKVGELVGVSPVKFPELEVGAEEVGRSVHSSEVQSAERCSEKEEIFFCCLGTTTRGSFLSGEGMEDRNIGEELMMGPRSAVVGQGMILSQLEEVGDHETLLVHAEKEAVDVFKDSCLPAHGYEGSKDYLINFPILDGHLVSRELEDVSLKDKEDLLVHVEREKEDAYRKSSEPACAFVGSKDYYNDFPMLDGRVESRVVEDGIQDGFSYNYAYINPKGNARQFMSPKEGFGNKYRFVQFFQENFTAPKRKYRGSRSKRHQISIEGCDRFLAFWERIGLYNEAIHLLRRLLNCFTCDTRRGYWTVRLSVDLEHIGCPNESLSVAEAGLLDPWIRAGSRMALQRRVLRLGKPPRRWKTPSFSESLKRKITEVHIQGRPLNCETGRKSRFYGEDGEQCGVEQLALQYYATGGGWHGVHTESGIWMTIFGLLMWDILFSDVPNVFRSRFQIAPLDMETDHFYPARKSLIESLLQKVHDGLAEEILITSWELHMGTACRGVNWDRHSLSDLRAAVSCIGGPCLASLCRHLAQDYRSWSRGMPDLLLWRFHGEYKGEAKLVEVKGPRDQLSEQQRACLLLLMDCGFNVEVCKVSRQDHPPEVIYSTKPMLLGLG